MMGSVEVPWIVPEVVPEVVLWVMRVPTRRIVWFDPPSLGALLEGDKPCAPRAGLR
jgi:hypothetical protein